MAMRNSSTTHSASNLGRFHRLEIEFCDKLVRRLNQEQEMVRWIMSLWLWFESIGHHNFIRHVSSRTDDVILSFVEEAAACIKRMKDGNNGDRGDELPHTSSLMEEPMDLRFFELHHDVAVVGIHKIFHNVVRIICDENIVEAPALDDSHPPSSRVTSASSEDGTSQQGASTTSIVEPRSSLNFMAEPWSPEINPSPQDQRSMFLTFSRGHPLTREEIIDFFTSQYGKCVEAVMIERTPVPTYGRVVFNNTSTIAMVLNGQETAKFVIRGRHLWARMYTSRNNQSLS